MCVVVSYVSPLLLSQGRGPSLICVWLLVVTRACGCVWLLVTHIASTRHKLGASEKHGPSYCSSDAARTFQPHLIPTRSPPHEKNRAQEHFTAVRRTSRKRRLEGRGRADVH